MSRKYYLSIEYRMTCEKSDRRNICQDSKRNNGFYWDRASSETVDIELKKMDIHFDIAEIMTLEEAMIMVETVSIPDGCEAIKAELTVYLPDSTGCNGVYRRNVSVQYFRDLLDFPIESAGNCNQGGVMNNA